MRAVVTHRGTPLSDSEALVDAEVPYPALRPRDLIIRVEAVSVNPVDVKRRAGWTGDHPLILGFDGAGTVVEVGPEVTGFAVGDDVWWAGDVTRDGSNAEFQAVDERIVGRKPATVSFAEAAAMPLTAVTAWECLYDGFQVTGDTTGSLLVLGGAGGVGSMVIQLAPLVSKLRVIATASRPESAEWVMKMGADEVVDHRDLVANTLAVAPGGVELVFSAFSDGRLGDFAQIIRPFGRISAIDNGTLDLIELKPKSVTWHWEYMFARSTYETADMAKQGSALSEIAEMVDAGAVVSTMTESIADFSAAGIRRAHELVEGGRMTGKVVVHR